MNLANLHIGSLPTPAHRDSRLPMLPSERKVILIPSGGVLGPLMVRPERPERNDGWRPFKVITRAVTGYDMRLICTHARCMPSQAHRAYECGCDPQAFSYKLWMIWCIQGGISSFCLYPSMIFGFAPSYLLLLQHSRLKLFEDSMERSWFGKLSNKENPA